jgi:hypothetical protein
MRRLRPPPRRQSRGLPIDERMFSWPLSLSAHSDAIRVVAPQHERVMRWGRSSNSPMISDALLRKNARKVIYEALHCTPVDRWSYFNERVSLLKENARRSPESRCVKVRARVIIVSAPQLNAVQEVLELARRAMDVTNSDDQHDASDRKDTERSRCCTSRTSPMIHSASQARSASRTRHSGHRRLCELNFEIDR